MSHSWIVETPFSWLQYPFGMALSSSENFLTLPQSDSKSSSSAFPHVVMKSAISPKSLGFSLGSRYGCGYWCVTAFRLSQQSEFGWENAHTHIDTYVSISLSIYIKYLEFLLLPPISVQYHGVHICDFLLW